MCQVHYAGDKLFIDYSGPMMPIVDQRTGEISKAQIFVSVLGASGYTFVHATPTQSTKDFIASHVLALGFMRVSQIFLYRIISKPPLSPTKKEL